MPEFVEDLMGAWMDESPAAKSLQAGGNTWRVHLPASPGEAQRTLMAQAIALDQDQATLEAAVARLKRFIEDYQPGDAGAAKALEAQPEAALRAHLSLAGGAQSKDLFDTLGNARAEFDQFVQRVRAFVTDYASIETTQHGLEIALTKVSWTGDAQTLWRQDVAPAQSELHHRNVRVALARRGMLMRLMVVISTGAAKIALRMATPGAQLLALPAIFQFIRDVVQEVREMQKIQAT